jgi:predicted acylesterase/phospholipase RssA
MTQIVYHNMVFSGGALRSITAIGCIQFLEEHNMMCNITTFIGTSAGSIISLLATLGMSSLEMTLLIKELNKKDYIKDLDMSEVLNLFQTYGINSGTIIERFISEALSKKLGLGDISFLELAKQTGKNLVVCVGNISKEREEFWSVDTTPTMSVIKAIRTSCSLPIIFTPVLHKGDLYVDGGLYNHFPIDFFKGSNFADVIGVHVRSLSNNKVDSIFSYMNRLLTSTMNVACRKNTPNYLIDNVVYMDMEDHALFSYEDFKLNLTEETIDEYVVKGYNEAKNQLTNIMLQ